MTRAWILIVGLALATVYGESLGHPFLLDDHTLIVNNQQLRHPSWGILTAPLRPPSAEAPLYYRPVQTLLLVIQHALWGLNPFGYHLTSLLLHWGNTLLLTTLWATLTQIPWLAAILGLAYAMHPMHTATVAYASGVADLLSTTGLLGMVLLYLRGHRRSAILCFAVALGSKETALIGPLLIALAAGYQARWNRRATPWRRLVPYLLVALSYLGLRLLAGSSQLLFHGEPLTTRLLMIPVVLWMDLRVLLLPYDPQLSRAIVLPPSVWTWWWLAAGLGAGLLLLSAALLWRRQPASRFWLGWITITLLPTLNLIVPLGHGMADHWLILPGIGMGGLLLQQTAQRIRGRWAIPLMMTLLLVWGSTNAATTFRYARYWGDPTALYAYWLQQNPAFANMRAYYAERLLATGQSAEALEQATILISQTPDFRHGWIILSKASLLQGETAQALWAIQHSFSCRGGLQEEAWRVLGLAYDAVGNSNAAEPALRHAVALAPHSEAGWITLGHFYTNHGDWAQAMTAFQQLVALRPEVVTYREWLAQAAAARVKRGQHP